MRIIMTPGLCSNEYMRTGGTFCECCFSSFLLHGCFPDRACINTVEEDGSEEITLVMRYEGYEKVVQLTEERREQMAFGEWKGWTEFVEQIPCAAG